MSKNIKKISVIVPVYNVEHYLSHCVRSIISQNYEDFEILLIDDGSKDNSGALCDDYQNKYENIRTFHKKNGGLSDARNYALNYVKGEYVMYIDSDDYIEPDTLKSMAYFINNSKNTDNADVVISPFIDEREDGSVLYSVKNKDGYVKMGSQKALQEMNYQQKFGTSACGKLIKTDLAKKYLFPVGRLYEDLATMYKIIGDANNVILMNHYFYHYIKHDGSIRFSQWSDKVFEILQANKELIEYVNLKYPEIYSSAIYRYFFSANEVYIRAFNNDNYLEIIGKIHSDLKKYWKIVKKDQNASLKQKARFFVMINYPELYRTIWCHIKG